MYSTVEPALEQEQQQEDQQEEEMRDRPFRRCANR